MRQTNADRLTLGELREAILITTATLACICLPCVGLVWFHSLALSPVPEPYPSALVTTSEHGVGNWGTMREESYRVNRSLAQVEQYYKEQMPKYCSQSVEFAEKSRVRDVWPCRELGITCYIASCKIPSLFDSGALHGQWFDVQLYPLNESTTEVVQITAWTD